MAQRVRLDEIFPATGEIPQKGFKGNASTLVQFIGQNVNAKRKFPETKARTILTLEMQGRTKTQIAQMMDLSIAGVCMICHRSEYRAMREKVLSEIDEEFLAMKPLAFDAVENGLRSNDENVSLKAADMWFKGAGFGAYSKTPPHDPTVTAEDVVRGLLQVNVNVTVPSSEARSTQNPDQAPVIDNVTAEGRD